MLDVFSIIYLFYSFVSLYFLSLFVLIFLTNRKQMHSFPPITKKYALSVVVPCYNEEESIGKTIQALLDSDYSNLKKIIVVDDCSTDGSYEVIKKFAKKYKKVIAVQTPKNSGKASGAKNYGAKFVDTELIGFTDADSYPEKDSIRKMIGFFDKPKVAAVTARVLAKKQDRFFVQLQAIEYKVISFTRKLLGFVDAIYVTPGPLAIYRRKSFEEVHGFDETNLTEDIEITWAFVKKGYSVAMSLSSRVYSIVPKKFKGWFNQRIRWNVGGIQTINKYKKSFFRTGMLGYFILPFFVFSWVLGLVGLGILLYRVSSKIIVNYLSVSYSVHTQTAILSMQDLSFAPSVLFFFGTVILLLSLLFTAFALYYSKEKEFKKHGLFPLLVYIVVYLSAYPLIMIASIYKFVRKEDTW